MNSFLIDKPSEGTVILSPDQAHHALRVLRVRPGEEVRMTDGKGGVWSGHVLSAKDGNVTLSVEEILCDNESPVRITLYQGLPKSDKLELIVQKAAELGVVRVCPVSMSRCVAKWDAKEAEKKRERLSRIAQEAVKQCKRGAAPEIMPLMSWNQALSHMKERALMLAPWEETRDGRMKDVYEKTPGAQDIGILIGPEGGISCQEAEQAESAGAICITLGPRILRCETAAICSCAMAQQLWGDI